MYRKSCGEIVGYPAFGAATLQCREKGSFGGKVMTQTIELADEITEDLHGERLDRALAIIFPDYSRSQLKGWIEKGLVTVDDIQVTVPKTPVLVGQEVTVSADTAVKAGLAEVGICTGSFYGNIGSFFGDICSFTNAFMLSAAGSVGAVSSFYGGQTATAIGFISGNLPGSGINMGSYAALVSGQALNVSSGSSFTAFFNSFFRAGLSAYGSGSLYIGSYNISSFNTFFGKYGSYKGFYAGSFGLSILSGLTAGSGISGSGGNFGQIGGFFAEDSIYRSADGIVITAEEYHRTLINLSSCPLNAYGYGINLI